MIPWHGHFPKYTNSLYTSQYCGDFCFLLVSFNKLLNTRLCETRRSSDVTVMISNGKKKTAHWCLNYRFIGLKTMRFIHFSKESIRVYSWPQCLSGSVSTLVQMSLLWQTVTEPDTDVKYAYPLTRFRTRSWCFHSLGCLCWNTIQSWYRVFYIKLIIGELCKISPWQIIL